MDRADNLSVVPYDVGWLDLGDWNAVRGHMEPDTLGVSPSGPATVMDCRNTLLRSESDRLEIIGHIEVVAMSDAVLIADKSRAQDMNKVVEALQTKAARSRGFLPESPAMGLHDSLLISGHFQVKRITARH